MPIPCRARFAKRCRCELLPLLEAEWEVTVKGGRCNGTPFKAQSAVKSAIAPNPAHLYS